MLKPTKIFHIVRNLLFSMLNKEFLIFLFFLALSGIFWLMKALDETYEEEIPVAVRLVGVPKNVVLTSSLPDTVRVTLRDKGFVLLAYTTSNRLRPVTVNFSSYANRQSGHGVLPVTDFQKSVRQQISASTTITSIKADRWDFYFNYGRNKVAKVVLQGNIVPADNYYLSHVQFSPEKVTVYASKEKLDSIRSIPTEYLNIVDFEDTVVRTVRLKTIPGVKVVPQTVKVWLYADILTDASIEVPITAINRPSGLVIRTFPQRVKVNFSVGARLFRQVRASDFQVVVDYREIAGHPSDKCNLYLRAKPRIVSNASLDMQQVDYLIEQQ